MTQIVHKRSSSSVEIMGVLKDCFGIFQKEFSPILISFFPQCSVAIGSPAR